MRRHLWSLIVVLTASAEATAQPTAQLTWDEVQEAAAVCSTKAHRVEVTPGFPGSPNWTYYLDRSAMPEQRQCFYRKANIGEVEQILREHDSEKK